MARPKRAKDGEATRDFLIREVSLEVMEAFRAKAESEGRIMRWVAIEMIKKYVREGL